MARARVRLIGHSDLAQLPGATGTRSQGLAQSGTQAQYTATKTAAAAIAFDTAGVQRNSSTQGGGGAWPKFSADTIRRFEGSASLLGGGGMQQGQGDLAAAETAVAGQAGLLSLRKSGEKFKTPLTGVTGTPLGWNAAPKQPRRSADWMNG
jgi:hypothetical protein